MNTANGSNHKQVIRRGIIGCGDVTEVKSGPLNAARIGWVMDKIMGEIS